MPRNPGACKEARLQARHMRPAGAMSASHPSPKNAQQARARLQRSRGNSAWRRGVGHGCRKFRNGRSETEGVLCGTYLAVTPVQDIAQLHDVGIAADPQRPPLAVLGQHARELEGCDRLLQVPVNVPNCDKVKMRSAALVIISGFELHPA